MPLHDRNIIAALEGISLSYEQKTILHNVNLTISNRDFVVITGANGGGKTSLLRLLLKLIKPTAGSVTYYSDGKEVDGLHIGYLPQKNMIDSRFPITVEEVVASGLYASQIAKEEKMRVESTVDMFGLKGFLSRTIGELSGGELQRALLARSVISQPQLLVLDEPLSYIDEAFAPRIYDILSQMSPSCAIVMVTHHPDKVASLATRMMRIDAGILIG
ncbi:MAG: metal ABC transporter ATP-binding protein [Bacteroidaceae bacterium]|nr:metal ABC transporter ATP-binding protein [Bacteroidaceae bacterium]